MNQNDSLKKGKFSFLIYDENGLPKYFSISKITLKSLIYGLPFITLICLLGVLSFLVYFKQIRAVVMRKEPQIITDLKSKNSKLITDKLKLETLVEKLVQKSASTKIDNLELGQLLLFNAPSGFKDLTRAPVFSIEEISIVRSNNNDTLLRFNIVNQTKHAEKKAGYAFVIMKDGSRYTIFPHPKESSAQMNIKYSSGESFATTKFRPVTAKFKSKNKTSLLLFKILIFSRSGDLLHKHFVTSEALQK